MACNERLAEHIRNYLNHRKGLEKKCMFGGLCFMPNSHLCCGIEKDRLMVRVMLDRYKTLLSKPYAHKIDLARKPLKDFLFISEAGYARHQV